MQLNLEQQKVVQADKGQYKVEACAGAGKTSVLVSRTVRLLQENVYPENILTLTFTSEAAKTLRTRIAEIEPIAASSSTERVSGPCTFHSFALSVCSKEHESFPFTLLSNPLATEGQCAKIGYEVASRHDVNYKAMRSWISLQKRNRVSPETAITLAEKHSENLKLALAYKKYDEALYASGTLDFDSLILETVKLFESRPDILDKYQYEFVMMDEGQDADQLQWKLLQLVAQKHGNVLVVGDENQAVYVWRGADVYHFRNMQEYFPDVQTLYLPTNYRSTQKIIEYTKKIAPESELIHRLNTPNEEGVDPVLSFYSTPTREAQEVVNKIAQQTGTVAVLSRTNQSLRAIEDQLADRDVKYYYLGDSGFYNRSEVKSVLAYLQCVAGITDAALCTAIRSPFHPSKYVKKKQTLDEIKKNKQESERTAWETLTQAANSNRAVQEFVNFIRGRIAYRDLPAKDAVAYVLRDLKAYEYYHEEEAIDADNNPVENLKELVRVAAKHDTLRDFLAFIRRVQAASRRRTGVCLATGHAAKGREWNTVFVIQACEGMLPHKRSTDIAEEQNLFYVMCSRAANALHISYTGTPSRFLKLEKDEVFD